MNNNKEVYLPKRITENSFEEDHSSFKHIININLNNVLMTQPFFDNCIFENCKLTDFGFISADILGTQFINCTLINVDFSNASISSCSFKNCEITNCIFDKCDVLNCQFTNCKIISDKFNDATIDGTIWINCVLDEFTPVNVSVYANDFSRCIFRNCIIKQSVFYTIFENCKLYDSELEAYILGSQFGLKFSNLHNCKFSHLSHIFDTSREALKFLTKLFEKENKIFEKNILNFINTNNVGNALIDVVNNLFILLNNGFAGKVEEIRFVRRIIEYVFKSNKLMPYYFLFIFNISQQLSARKLRQQLTANLFNEVLLLYNSIYVIKTELINRYAELNALLKSNYSLITDMNLEIIYNECPSTRLSSICNNIEFGNKIYPIYERKGSFIEGFNIKDIIEFAAAILTMLDMGFKAAKNLVKKINEKLKHKHQESKGKHGCKSKYYRKTTYKIKITYITKVDSLDFSENQLTDFEVALMNRIFAEFDNLQNVIIKEYSKSNIKRIWFK